MRDELKTLIQTAVRLDAQIFRVRIGDVQQFFGIVTVCTAAINFQFDAEMPQALAMKHKITFVDIAGIVKGASEGEGLGNKFLANIREADARTEKKTLSIRTQSMWMKEIMIPREMGRPILKPQAM